MRIKCFRVQNFRRLKDVLIHLDPRQTIFVGANNSGKTSATHLFHMFLCQHSPFQIYDFSADCWDQFSSFSPATGNADTELPQITFDLWFDVDSDNVHRALDILPNLDWAGEPVGVRMVYAPRDGSRLVANYVEARTKAEQEIADIKDSAYKPWPQTMLDYMRRRLADEYEIKYFKLDANRCNADFLPDDGYQPFPMGTQASGAAKVMNSIVRVDFLDAQRHLSDIDSRGRSEDLSKRLSRFYNRNLQKLENDFDALATIADSEAKLNAHFAKVFSPTLDRLGELGYPGISNPGLVLKASFDARGILNTSAKIHYALPVEQGLPAIDETLPDQYNGLGFKNLIYMVIEVLDFHQEWADKEIDRAPIHLVMIEEPEVHLHAQLQQVFIRKILDILPKPESGFHTQLVVTTHSPHIIYESNFTPIRYFARSAPHGLHLTDVKDLSIFYDNEEIPTREFLQQYIKLTHCDLFFADAATLVEGNVERLLLPAIIRRFVPALRSCHLTILEVGGAFAHCFEKLAHFLGLPTLVITDLDSCSPAAAGQDPDEQADLTDDSDDYGPACMVDTPGAVTSNQTLRQWLPKMNTIAQLLNADEGAKSPPNPDGSAGLVRVAYQTAESVSWQGETEERTGRTLEEAFALQNLAWTQSDAGKDLGLKIANADQLPIAQLHVKLYSRVRHFDKTRFALSVIATLEPTWVAPAYIIDGLQWLRAKLELPIIDGIDSDTQPPAADQ
ncbi:ATP-dependent endonuclease [Mycobacterium sp. 852002-40037_SCH5390672]|uniref:ATP-dependent nuclease n=1 Tax=Mycobacterium sp. 852002-40037_SCH5390672 TaxID=1834089 RepID=UPI0008056775|nr:ATP-dependent endonuclease [Mycobacterium sp. 852002-40037_SCH5390672]OBB91394.1 hypothetical protein A5782_15295 [Mycobacterium sp. 852002-40037_SCH5390672]